MNKQYLLVVLMAMAAIVVMGCSSDTTISPEPLVTAGGEVIDASVRTAWGASRMIEGSRVTISVNPSGSEGIFTVREILDGATISDSPSACGVNQDKTVLTCDYDKNVAGTIVYTVAGSGSVSGVIAGVSAGESISVLQEIEGDEIIIEELII